MWSGKKPMSYKMHDVGDCFLGIAAFLFTICGIPIIIMGYIHIFDILLFGGVTTAQLFKGIAVWMGSGAIIGLCFGMISAFAFTTEIIMMREKE